MRKIIIYAILVTLGVSCDKEELESPATLLNTNLTYGSLEDIDGNIYSTIQIGEQIWMANNLRTTRFSNGDSIPRIVERREWQNDSIGAWTYYMDESTLNSKHGKLYNWCAVNNFRNICPEGWHVPTLEEWSTLLIYLGGRENAGKKMKSKINGAWATEYNGQVSHAQADNESGFSSVASGTRNIDGQFSLMTYRASYWSKTKANTWYPAAYSCELFWNGDAVNLLPENKDYGLCIRCIMD